MITSNRKVREECEEVEDENENSKAYGEYEDGRKRVV